MFYIQKNGAHFSLDRCLKHSGASLIEVLFALFLLGLTVSAAFGLQLRAVHLLEYALLKETAFEFLVGAKSAILANPAGMPIYQLDTHWAQTNSSASQLSHGCRASKKIQCTPQARALSDIERIQQRVKLRFPGSRVGVHRLGTQEHHLILNWSGHDPNVCVDKVNGADACASLSVWM